MKRFIIEKLVEWKNNKYRKPLILKGARQIGKMCEKLGLEVARLKRIAIGSVKLGMLQPGKWRNLTVDEIRRLSTSSR